MNQITDPALIRAEEEAALSTPAQAAAAPRRALAAVLAASAALAALGAAYWYSPAGPGWVAQAAAVSAPAAPMAVPVETALVQAATAARTVKAVGTLAANESVQVSPEVAGQVAEVLFRSGQPVKAGEPLIRLDDQVVRAELDEARAALELSRRQHQRAADLLERGVGTVRARDEALSSLRRDEARVRLTTARLEKTVVRAPFDGVVGLRRVSVGDHVAPGESVVNLEQVSPLKVLFQVPERFLPEVRPGQTVSLRSEAYPDRPFAATVAAVDPRVDPATRSLVVEALHDNADGRLRPGQFVAVELSAQERWALFVPEQAVQPSGDKTLVHRVRDGRAEAVEIRTGARTQGQVEVVGGLAEGDVVVTAGFQKLGPGAPVAAAPPTAIVPARVETVAR